MSYTEELDPDEIDKLADKVYVYNVENPDDPNADTIFCDNTIVIDFSKLSREDVDQYDDCIIESLASKEEDGEILMDADYKKVRIFRTKDGKGLVFEADCGYGELIDFTKCLKKNPSYIDKIDQYCIKECDPLRMVVKPIDDFVDLTDSRIYRNRDRFIKNSFIPEDERTTNEDEGYE